MSEFSERSGRPDLDAVKYLIKPPEPEKLRIAQAVIQDVVNTSEETISESSNLDNISGHSAREIRAALGTKAQQIMSMPGSRFRHNYLPTAVEVSKQTKDGVACLWLGSKIDSRGNPIPGLLSLHLGWTSGKPPKLMLNTDISLQELSEHHSAFGDWRNGRISHVTSQRLEGEFDLSSVRYLWRGLRWLSANLNVWETPDFIMPERLPQHPVQSLPKPTPRQLT